LNRTHPRWWRGVLPLVLLLLPLAAACGKAEEIPLPPPPTIGRMTIALGDRPFSLYVPSAYESDTPVPLVVGLHGYTSHSGELESYFRLTALAEQRGFLYATPDGTTDPVGDQFWNATDACCDLYRRGVDDSGYLSDLIDEVEDLYSVTDVYVVGHSNGGYMSHRMACDHADQITAIVSLAGAVWSDPSQCSPSRAVTVLQIHGTADHLVRYEGGEFAVGTLYPGAEATVARWRELDGCDEVADTSAPALDLDSAAPGPETTITTYTCRNGTRVGLWRMEGSGHVPALTADFSPAILDFLFGGESS
jgi:polyhydroxybutyrate depolymerase